MSTTAQPQISVRHVSKQYATHTVFDDISFDIQKGEFVAMIGPNGAGKTTLVRLLLGLDVPTAGTVFIDGEDVQKKQHSFGYIPQRFSFDRTLPVTVQEFLTLIRCSDDAHVSLEHVLYMLEQVGLSGLEKQHIGTLSGGQLQRLLIARALIHHRSILILDEPAAGVDVHGEQQIYELLKRINTQFGTTCIVVSHELGFVFSYASSVLCINKKLLCHGTPDTVLSDQLLTKLFGEHKSVYRHQC